MWLSICMILLIPSIAMAIYEELPYPMIEIERVGDYDRKKDFRISVTITSKDRIGQPSGAEICKNPIPVPICLGQEAKMQFSCSWRQSYSEHMELRNRNSSEAVVHIGRNEQIDINSTTYTYIKVEMDPPGTEKDCYYCWVQRQNQIRISQAVIPLYIDCESQRITASTIQERNVHLGSSVTSSCWNEPILINHTVSWFKIHTYELSMRRPMSQSSLPSSFILADSMRADFPEEASMRLISNGSTSITMPNISIWDAGVYSCMIWFKDENVIYENLFSLKLLATISTIRTMDLIDANRNTLVVNLTRGDNNFLAEVAQKGAMKLWYHPITAPDHVVELIIPLNKTVVMIQNLQPATLYRVEFYDINDYGQSEPAIGMFLTGNSSNDQPKTLGGQKVIDEEVGFAPGQKVVLKCYNYEDSPLISWWELSHYSGPGGGIRYSLRTMDNSSKFETGEAGIYVCIKKAFEGNNVHIDPWALGTHRYTIRVAKLEPPAQFEKIRCNAIENGPYEITWAFKRKPKIVEETSWGDPAAYEERQRNRGFLSNRADYYRIEYKKLGSNDQWQEKIVQGNEEKVVLSEVPAGNMVLQIRVTAINAAGQNNGTQGFCAM